MDGDELRGKVNELMSSTGLGASRGGAFERPKNRPPYLVPEGTHPIEKRMAAEAEPEAEPHVAVSANAIAVAKSMIGAPGANDDTQSSNALPSNDDVHTLFTMAGALFPPYDPEVLTAVYEHSNSLRPNVEAYLTNIDSFGYSLEPIINLDANESDEQVGDAMFLERLREAELRGERQAAYPAPDEIAKRKVELKALMRLERAQIENFIEHCAGEISFKELRRRTRSDVEVTGNAYWECVRDGTQQLAGFHFVPSYSMRLAPIEHELHEHRVNRRVSPFRYEHARVKTRFRRFIQVVLDRIVFFKEFGDSRVISKRTGKVFPNVEELTTSAQHDGPATEVLHFKVYSSRSPYGVPRWIGALLCVLGSRASEEVNYLYFDNKTVPPMALLVSGGKLAQEAKSKIESFIADNIRGKENFHKMLVIEAESGGAPSNRMQETGRVRVELVPLTGAQHDDALFQSYDQNNIDKVGSQFRVPRLLRGDVRDFNRATADAALQYAEMQVFQPEREAFDDLMNRRVFSDLGVRFWRFVSKSPVNREPGELADILQKIGPYLTGEEGREVAGDILNKELKRIADEWVKQPVQMTLAGMVRDPITGDIEPPAGGAGDGGTAAPKAAGDEMPTPAERALTTLAGKVIALRDSLQAQAQRKYQAEVRKQTAEDGRVVLKMPRADFEALFVPDDAKAG